MTVLGSTPEALALMLSAALVGAVFANLQEVNRFIWGWVRSLTIVIGQFVTATEASLLRLFTLAAEFLAQAVQIFVPFTSKTLELFQLMWTGALRNETAPVRRGLEKIEELRTRVHAPIATWIAELTRILRERGWRVLHNINVQLLQSLQLHIDKRGIDIFMARNVEALIADQARKATEGYKAIADALNEGKDWWRQVVTADGYLQPKTVLATSTVLSGPLVGLLANVGIRQDRDEDVAQQIVDFPRQTVPELVAHVTSGEILNDATVLSAVSQLEELLALPPSTPGA